MERIIPFAELTKVVEEAYEHSKDINDGTADPRVPDVQTERFGISIMLTDGRTIGKADTDFAFPLGEIAKIPMAVTLLGQNTLNECPCHCRTHGKKSKPDIPFSAHGIRAASAVAPQGDPEGKYGILADTMMSLTDMNPVFCNRLFNVLQEQACRENVVEKINSSGYRLMDDTALSLITYLKMMSLQLNTRQLAALGATIAADGHNPVSGEYVFDKKIAPTVTALMAVGKHRRGWMLHTGLPGCKGFGGSILAILPGFGAVAAYAPKVCERGLSVKGAKAIAYIAKKLCLNVFASERVRVQ